MQVSTEPLENPPAQLPVTLPNSQSNESPRTQFDAPYTNELSDSRDGVEAKNQFSGSALLKRHDTSRRTLDANSDGMVGSRIPLPPSRPQRPMIEKSRALEMRPSVEFQPPIDIETQEKSIIIAVPEPVITDAPNVDQEAFQDFNRFESTPVQIERELTLQFPEPLATPPEHVVEKPAIEKPAATDFVQSEPTHVTDRLHSRTTPKLFALEPRMDRADSEVQPGVIGTRIIVETFDAFEEPPVDAKYGLPVGNEVEFQDLPTMDADPETSALPIKKKPENDALLVVYRDHSGKVFLAPPAKHVPDQLDRIAPIIPINPSNTANGEYYQPPISMLRLKAKTPIEKPVVRPSVGSIKMRDLNFVEGSHLLKQRETLEAKPLQAKKNIEHTKPYMLQSAVERLMPKSKEVHRR